MSELSEELRDLQAVCERLGVDDDDALNRAADRIEELEAQLESIYDRFVDGNCTETYINIAPLIKAAIKGEEVPIRDIEEVINNE